mmetsp:Transcript_34345/g.80384  ORF Transcript_34345/g.80384 Transcript_34345/m.80384 type:complete len:146 (+) Transcript_34345:283-720(+)
MQPSGQCGWKRLFRMWSSCRRALEAKECRVHLSGVIRAIHLYQIESHRGQKVRFFMVQGTADHAVITGSLGRADWAGIVTSVTSAPRGMCASKGPRDSSLPKQDGVSAGHRWRIAQMAVLIALTPRATLQLASCENHLRFSTEPF